VVSNPPPICVVPMVPALQNSSWGWPSASNFFLSLLIVLTRLHRLPSFAAIACSTDGAHHGVPVRRHLEG
jgi:hypothetical protein